MSTRPAAPVAAKRLLELARKDPGEAKRALAAEPVAHQVELVCETPAPLRARLLALLPHPEQVIPELPEAELCFTVRASGLPDAGWMLAYASDEQIVACLDLDAWQGAVLDTTQANGWLQALVDAGGESLVRAARALDPELLVLTLKARIEVWLKPNDEDWQPPPGARSLEGQFYFRALGEGDDLAEVEALLRALFEQDYWLYFRLLQGSIWEIPSDTEEWALRWRTGRLEDLGFPPWDEAMRIYGYVRPGERARIPERARALEVEGWRLPVWLPRLPSGADARHALFRAIEKLDDDERRACFYAFVSLANKVAVADRMNLGDADSIPRAIEKAASVASRGLELVARENHLDPSEVLRRVPLERLFRVGASLDRPASTPVASGP